MSYVVQASPFSKMYIPEWAERCVHEPELLSDEKVDFVLTIPRSTGAIVLKHNRPVHISTLIPRTRERITDEDEITPLLDWLTGGANNGPARETDIYGVVAIDVGRDFEDMMSEMMQLVLSAAQTSSPDEQKKLFERQANVQKSIVTDMSVKLAAARKIADDRVKKALGVTHTNLVRSWEALQIEGKGTYAPSHQESLGAHILKDEINKRLELNRKLFNNVAENIPGAQRR